MRLMSRQKFYGVVVCPVCGKTGSLIVTYYTYKAKDGKLKVYWDRPRFYVRHGARGKYHRISAEEAERLAKNVLKRNIKIHELLNYLLKCISEKGYVTMEDAEGIGMKPRSFLKRLRDLARGGILKKWEKDGKIYFTFPTRNPPIEGAEPADHKKSPLPVEAVLEVIEENGGAASIPEIAKKLEKHYEKVKRAVRRLEEIGLVKKMQITRNESVYATYPNPASKAARYYLKRLWESCHGERQLLLKHVKRIERIIDPDVRKIVLENVLRVIAITPEQVVR